MHTGLLHYSELSAALQVIARARYEGAGPHELHRYIIDAHGAMKGRLELDVTKLPPSCYAVLRRAPVGQRIVRAVRDGAIMAPTAFDDPSLSLSAVYELVEQLNRRLGVSPDDTADLLTLVGYDLVPESQL